MSDYPAQYLEALHLFNEEDFFECHDVLEELWSETLGPEKRFYQGLIQIAISLFHFGNENYGGARKLYESSRKYLQEYLPTYQGIDVAGLLDTHEVCFRELLSTADPYQGGVELQDDLIPKIAIPAE